MKVRMSIKGKIIIFILLINLHKNNNMENNVFCSHLKILKFYYSSK